MTNSNESNKATGAKTNKVDKSLVKTIVLQSRGKWVQPKSGENFFITEDAKFPLITFEIDTTQRAPFEWSWILSWPAGVSGLKNSAKRGKVLKTFSERGNFLHDSKKWVVDLAGKTIGGVLTVEVKAGKELFKRTVLIKGKNPGEQRVKALLSTIADVKGFDKVLAQESHFRNFIESDGQPVVSFDGGYGLSQMTNPAPTFEQCWNWKENIKCGTALYIKKQQLAKAYLSKHNRKYTDEQLELETLSLWNGGHYHVWNNQKNAWERNPNILCDTNTGNIGWDMRNSSNSGKSEDELHERDKDEYKTPPKKDKRLWNYTGVCYADHLQE